MSIGFCTAEEVKLNGDDRQIRLDGFANVLSGIGTYKDRAKQYSFAIDARISFSVLDNLYRADSICSEIIDLLPDDMTREDIVFEEETPEITKIKEELERLDFYDLCNQALKQARLHGGAVILFDIEDGQDISEPLDVENVSSIESILVLDKNYLSPIDYKGVGKPQKYLITNNSEQRIYHNSRLFLFDGIDRGLRNRIENNSWGESVIDQSLYDAIKNYTIANNLYLTVIETFLQTVMKFDDLNSILSSNQEEAFLKKLILMNQSRSLVGSLVMDKNDDFQMFSANLTGLKEMVDSAKNRLSALSNIPSTRLFSEPPPSSLGDLGASMLRDWYDAVKTAQKKVLRPQFNKLFEILSSIHEFKNNKIDYEFKNLWQIKETERADIEVKEQDALLKKVQAIKTLLESDVIDTKEAKDLFNNEYKS